VFALEALDEASGAAALGRIHALVSSQPVTISTAPRLNQRAAASTTLAMLAALGDLKLGPRLKRLADHGELDGAALGRLPDLARAAWYLRYRQDHDGALKGEAKIPESLFQQATELRSRMLQLLDFLLGADAAVAAELAVIRQGTGYQDLAGDLVALSKLYGSHHSFLKGALPLHHRETDAKEAPRVAAQIIAELGKSQADKGNRSQSILLVQVTQQLVSDYEEVAAAARFLTRKQPESAARFPNLFVASQRAKSTRPETPPSPEPSPSGQ